MFKAINLAHCIGSEICCTSFGIFDAPNLKKEKQLRSKYPVMDSFSDLQSQLQIS